MASAHPTASSQFSHWPIHAVNKCLFIYLEQNSRYSKLYTVSGVCRDCFCQILNEQASTDRTGPINLIQTQHEKKKVRLTPNYTHLQVISGFNHIQGVEWKTHWVNPVLAESSKVLGIQNKRGASCVLAAATMCLWLPLSRTAAPGDHTRPTKLRLYFWYSGFTQRVSHNFKSIKYTRRWYQMRLLSSRSVSSKN